MLIGLVLQSSTALAHHAMGGATPTTAWQGFASGLAHPVLGLDHLAFIVAAGSISTLHPRGVYVPLLFVFTSLLATCAHALGFDLPAAEGLGLASVVLIGAALIGTYRNARSLLGLVAAAGVFHGYAYGETIVGTEATPLQAYLLGLGAVQIALALAVRYSFCRMTENKITAERGMRLAGYGVALTGLTCLAWQIHL
jgi:urease accessory protein